MTIETLYNPSESVWIITENGITAATIEEIKIKTRMEGGIGFACHPIIFKEYTFFHEDDSRTEDKIFKTRDEALEHIINY